MKQWEFVLAIIAALLSIGNGFKQELWLYNNQSNALYFSAQDPDLSKHITFLSTVNKVCTFGRWHAFSRPNFHGKRTVLGSLSNSNLICLAISAIDFRSIRHLAADDTRTDSISLYTGEFYSGEEIMISEKVKTAIPVKIVSVAITGVSDWMLFEGKYLDGKSFCYSVPYPHVLFDYDHVSALALDTIGSVFKGCNLQEIQSYRQQYYF